MEHICYVLNSPNTNNAKIRTNGVSKRTALSLTEPSSSIISCAVLTNDWLTTASNNYKLIRRQCYNEGLGKSTRITILLENTHRLQFTIWVRGIKRLYHSASSFSAAFKEFCKVSAICISPTTATASTPSNREPLETRVIADFTFQEQSNNKN